MASVRQTFRIFKTGFSFVLDRDSPYGAQNEKIIYIGILESKKKMDINVLKRRNELSSSRSFDSQERCELRLENENQTC